MSDNALTELVDQLTAPHPHVAVVRGQPLEGTELALLGLLHAAVGSTTSSDGGKGGGTPSVIDADALALWTSIRTQIHAGATACGAMVPELGKVYELPVTVGKLRAWYRYVNTKGASLADQINLYARCLTWVEDIRNHFEPEKKVPMRGLACGTCGLKTYKGESGNRGPAIVLHYTRPAPVAVCQACGETWSGGELLDLKAGKPAAQQAAPTT